MNTEIKERWVEALRSGKYKQGNGALSALSEVTGERGFCCLGVLCELAVEDGIIKRHEWNEQDKAERYEYDGAINYPSEKVQEWASLDERNPQVEVKNFRGILAGVVDTPRRIAVANLNDSYGYTFDEIADVIEASL